MNLRAERNADGRYSTCAVPDDGHAFRLGPLEDNPHGPQARIAALVNVNLAVAARIANNDPTVKDEVVVRPLQQSGWGDAEADRGSVTWQFLNDIGARIGPALTSEVAEIRLPSTE